MVNIYRWKEKEYYDINDLVGIMQLLRGEGGCPWDKEQTHTSIRNDLLEEAYETIDAIDRLDDIDMTEELGDLLLQVVFHCQIANERHAYNFDTVADGICKKLIYRHPHIFSDIVVNSSDEVLSNWDKLKNKEKNIQTFSDTLKAVPKSFPSCTRAQKIQKRAAKAGYDFKSVNDAVLKIEEELNELKSALSSDDIDSASSEIGDLLFSAVNVARHLSVNAEQQLYSSIERFITRFSLCEDLALSEGKNLQDLNDAQLDELWQRAKENLK